MQSLDFVDLVARTVLRAWDIREQSWMPEKHKYKISTFAAVEQAVNESGLTGRERAFAIQCAGGGFQGEFVELSRDILAGKYEEARGE